MKLDAYFDAVRAAEQELTEVQAWLDRPKPVVGEEAPTDIPDPARAVENAHTPVDLPILLAGGDFAHGTHVVHEGEYNAPFCNLFVTMLQNMGVETDSFGQSTGTLTWS